MNPQEAQLTEILQGCGIQYITGYELLRVGRLANGIGPALKPAPRILWVNIIPTALLVERARRFFNAPVTIHSGYRDLAYNYAVGGARSSIHVSFNAMDVSIQGIAPITLYRYFNRQMNATKFGIGLYRTFVHIDTRGHLGIRSPARW